jgi:hypothetical protein
MLQSVSRDPGEPLPTTQQQVMSGARDERSTGFITHGRMLHTAENQQVSGLKMAAWVDVPHRPSKIASMVKEKRMRVSCRVIRCCIGEVSRFLLRWTALGGKCLRSLPRGSRSDACSLRKRSGYVVLPSDGSSVARASLAGALQ